VNIYGPRRHAQSASGETTHQFKNQAKKKKKKKKNMTNKKIKKKSHLQKNK
jgi:hypothetical protein